MRSLIVATLAAIAATAAPMDYSKMFAEFKIQHGRRYSTEKEEAQRFETFVANMKKAEQLSALNPQATFGASPYADYTEAEFKSYHNGNAHFAAAQKDRKNVKTVAMSAEEKKRAYAEARARILGSAEPGPPAGARGHAAAASGGIAP